MSIESMMINDYLAVFAGVLVLAAAEPEPRDVVVHPALRRGRDVRDVRLQAPQLDLRDGIT